MIDKSQPPVTQKSEKPKQALNHEELIQDDRFKLERSRVAPALYKPITEETIYAWKAPSRPFKKRNRKFFTSMVVIALLVSMILFFSGQFLPIAVVVSVVFLLYVLAVIPPEEVSYSVTNYGIKVEDGQYYWEEMGRFWFDKKNDSQILSVEIVRFPGRLTFVINKNDKKPLSLLLSEVLLQDKPDLTTYEKVAKWMHDKVPLD